MSAVSMLDRTQTRYDGINHTKSLPEEEQYISDDIRQQAVIVESNSIIINPQYMNQDDFYPAKLNGKLFLYHKVNDYEIDVYELAG